MSDDKKFINRIPIDPKTHTWLVAQANTEGTRLASYAGTLLDGLMSEWTPPEDDDNPNRRLFFRSFKFERRKWLREKVYRAAAQYVEDPTDEAADDLAAMCEDAGLDYREVIDKAGSDPFSSIIAMSRNGTKFGECLRWLPDKLTQSGGSIAVAALQALGAQHGFTPSMLSRVKRAIDADKDTPSIRSVKSGRSWVWIINQEEPEPPSVQGDPFSMEL